MGAFFPPLRSKTGPSQCRIFYSFFPFLESLSFWDSLQAVLPELRRNGNLRSLYTGLGLGVGLCLLAACGPLSQPFAPGTRSNTEKTFLLPPQGPGLWMGNFKGLPKAQAVRVAGTVLATLHAEGIPASAANRNEASLLLNGEATATETAGGLRLDLDWTLRTADGEIGHVHESKTLPAADWERDPRHLDRLAVAAAHKIARLARGNAPLSSASDPASEAIAIWPITGAPGDGQRALFFALRSAMARAGIPQVGENQEPGLILLGDVHTGDVKAGQQSVEIAWSLIRPDGKAVGAFTQKNTIPAGGMDAAWGRLAPAIAAGPVAGSPALIEAMRHENGSKPF